MKFKKESLLELMGLRKNGITEDGLKLIDEGKWQSEGKYEAITYIFQFEDSFYWVHDSRTGSYHSEYYYDSQNWKDEIECSKVRPQEITTIEWREVELEQGKI